MEALVRAGDAATLHARDIVPQSAVERLLVARPAIVSGSTQSLAVVDVEEAARRGFDIVRRRSGGGAVILQPSDHGWVDITIPRTHPRWDDDVERATWWVGDLWTSVLRDARVVEDDAEWVVHRASLNRHDNSRSVCFAALGPGEVSYRRGQSAHKVLGIAQRRTKDAARFQCLVYRDFDVDLHSALLRLEHGPLVALSNVRGVGAGLEMVIERVVAAFVAELG